MVKRESVNKIGDLWIFGTKYWPVVQLMAVWVCSRFHRLISKLGHGRLACPLLTVIS